MSKDIKILLTMLTIGILMILLVLLIVRHVNAVITEPTLYTTTIAEYRQLEAMSLPSEQPSRGAKALVFEATAYCYGNITATGTKPTPGRTVAADIRILPYGTKLIINGVPGYVVEDCGNYWSDELNHTGYYKHIRGNRIDIFMSSKQECLSFGRREVLVEIE